MTELHGQAGAAPQTRVEGGVRSSPSDGPPALHGQGRSLVARERPEHLPLRNASLGEPIVRLCMASARYSEDSGTG
jgi:hypothetical protein